MPLPLVAAVPLWADEQSGCDGDGGSEAYPAVDGYKISAKLGAGTSGNVYAAEDDSHHKVAMKVLHNKALLARFVREAEFTCDLPPHPNLVTGLGWGESCGRHFLAMEFVNGRSLEEWLIVNGRLDWQPALQIALQVSAALGHLAAHGITHRDVKPSNIMVEPTIKAGGTSSTRLPTEQQQKPTATLIDLGLARAINQCDDDAVASAAASSGGGEGARMLRVRTPAFSSIGSPAFMAPECVADARCADARSDIYGLGATLYACVTGRLPFDGATPMRVMQQVMKGEMRPPGEFLPGGALPRGVEALILWLLERDARERPQSCHVGRELDVAMRALLDAPDDASIVERARRQARARRKCDAAWRWLSNAATALVVLACLVGVGMMLCDLRPTDEAAPAAVAPAEEL